MSFIEIIKLADVATPKKLKETLNNVHAQLHRLDELVQSGSITVDSELSNTSTNPVQNMVVKVAIDNAENAGISAHNKADEVSQSLYAYRQSNDMEVGLLKSDVEQLKQSGGSITVDTELNPESNNPIANKAVAEEVGRQDTRNTDFELRITALESGGGEVDLSEYVKKTDYATDTTPGIIKGGYPANSAIYINTGGGYGEEARYTLFINSANENNIRARKRPRYGNGVGVIAPDNMDLALRIALTVEHENRTTLTDDEKTAACNYLGAVKQTANEGNRVYVSQNRNNTTIGYSTQAQGSTIACRGTNGELKVGTPTESTHATTKEYVDNAIANSGGGGGSVTVDTELNLESNNPIANKAVAEEVGRQDTRNTDFELRITALEGAKFYLHKISFSTKTSEDSNTGAYNADVIEIIILNKQSTQLTKDYFLSLSGAMFNTSISKVFYKESNSGSGQSTVTDETTRFDVQQTGEYTFEVINLSNNAIGTMNFSTLSFYDRVIDL